MALAHLSIGTATNRINLFDRSGFWLLDWTVAASEHDATFQESNLADFRQMVAYRDVTHIETFSLTLKTATQDIAARKLQEMRAMLRLMLDYWTTTYQTDVVYLAARASCETNMRYAVVYDGRLVGESNPYGQPFRQTDNTAVMDTLTLIVERGPWLENVPGTGTAIAIGTTQTYDGRTVGNVDDTETADLTTNAQEVFVANKHNVAQLTDIYYWDDSAGAWSGNLMDAALPFAFLPPAPLEVDDFVIFGIDTSIADSGPFDNLVLDIGTALGVGGGITIEWLVPRALNTEDPSTWAGLSIYQDNTNDAGAMTGVPFNTTGVGSVHWHIDSSWDEKDPDPTGADALGVTGYWIAAYVTAVAGAPSPPTQQNRDIYTITWPYIELGADEVNGDMPALLRITADCRSAQDGEGTTTDLWSQRLIAGLRSMDRGDDYTAFINLANEQTPTGATITLGTNTAWFDRITTPAGNTARYGPGAGAHDWNPEIYVALSSDWYGRFHAFVRTETLLAADGTEAWLRLGYAPGDSSNYGEKKTVERALRPGTYGGYIHDFGEIVLGPSADIYPYEMYTTYVNVEVATTGVWMAYIMDLILIPVDEWAWDCEDMFKNSGASQYTNDYLTHVNIDAIQNPRMILSHLVRNGTDDISRYWRPITNGIPMLLPNKRQRLWFLSVQSDPYDSTTVILSRCNVCHSIQLWKNQRYTTLRGDQ
jgi:hypothetical protein